MDTKSPFIYNREKEWGCQEKNSQENEKKLRELPKTSGSNVLGLTTPDYTGTGSSLSYIKEKSLVGYKTPTVAEGNPDLSGKPTPLPPSENTFENHYLEYTDKTYNGSKPLSEKEEGAPKKECGVGWVNGKCEGGHNFAKKLYCHQEWCPVCGQDDSEAHKRRMARWWGKVMQMSSMGYLVITIPEHLRDRFKNKESLNALRRYWVRKLKREGYNRGLCRYHWAGDTNFGKWHPHLNLLFDGNYIEKGVLELWREEYKRWLENYLGVSLEEVDIRYGYKITKRKKIFTLKYVTRATLRWEDPKLMNLLYRFRTMMSWGNWEKWEGEEGEDKEMDILDKIQRGICPICGKRIHWFGYILDIPLTDFKEIGSSGYYIDKWSFYDSNFFKKYSV